MDKENNKSSESFESTTESVVENLPIMSGRDMGYLGLSLVNGVQADEMKKELNFPRSLNTYREMSYHAAVNAPLTLYENILCELDWGVTPPVDATEEEIKQAKIIESMLHDMDQPWSEFIKDVCSMLTYGFTVHEKSFKFREKGKSKYNDGYVGIKGLHIRAQESLKKFEMDDNGSKILGVVQSPSKLNLAGLTLKRPTVDIEIPRSKFLLFRMGRHRGSPYGVSPLKEAYLAWRFLQTVEDIEATGLQKDLNGLPLLGLPPQYLSDSATESQKQLRAYYENAIRNIHMNNQAGMMIPLAYDPDTRQPLFDFKLLSVDGKKSYDTDKIKTYYKNLIFTSLFADVLVMGQTNTGSFALGAIKNSLSGAYAEKVARHIASIINHELIPDLYRMNGWGSERMAQITFEGSGQADLDTLSKFWQRVKSVGLVEVDRPILNAIRIAGGVDPLADSLPPQKDLMSEDTSRSGDGFKTAGVGTSTGVTGEDTSSNNLENS